MQSLRRKRNCYKWSMYCLSRRPDSKRYVTVKQFTTRYNHNLGESPLECIACALNEISSSDGCVACDADKVAENNECSTCSIDEFIFTKTDGQRECKECSKNEIAEGNSCNKCPKGQVRDSTKDPRECKDCPVNNVSTENGCIQCPDDQG